MGLLDRFKAKESRFTAWLKSDLHMAALPAETRGDEVLQPFLGRLSGERLLLKLEPDHADAIVSLGLDDRAQDPPALVHFYRQELADLRQASMDDQTASPFPPGWVLDSDSDATLAVLVVAPKALRKLLESCSQRIRTLSFHGQGLSASLHLHREEPQRLSQDLAVLLELLKFQRDPKEEAVQAEPPAADEAGLIGALAQEEVPTPVVAEAEPQLDLLSEPAPEIPGELEAAPPEAAQAHPTRVHVTVRANGPLIIDGPLDLETADGGHQIVEGQHNELCRCGKSGNKPFCDCTHQRIGFMAK